jgi:hypothetical protein
VTIPIVWLPQADTSRRLGVGESRRPKTVAAATREGGRLESLVALRDTLAHSIDSCDSLRDLASLSRQLTDVLAQIESLLPAESKGDDVDEIAARRAARRASSATG